MPNQPGHIRIRPPHPTSWLLSFKSQPGNSFQTELKIRELRFQNAKKTELKPRGGQFIAPNNRECQKRELERCGSIGEYDPTLWIERPEREALQGEVKQPSRPELEQGRVD